MKGLARMATRTMGNVLENPQVAISSENISEWMGGARPSSAGVNVGEHRVMGLSAWYRGVTMIASTIAGLPLNVMQKSDRSPVLSRTVLDDPNPAQTPFEFWQMMVAGAVGHGNAYAELVRSPGLGTVQEAWPLHPRAVECHMVPRTPENPVGKMYHITRPDGTFAIKAPEDILHLPYMCLDGRVGVSPLQLFRETLGISIAGEETSGRFYGNGTQLSGTLNTDQELTNDQAEAMKTRWAAKNSGLVNAGNVAVLDRGLTFQSVMCTPADAQLLDSRKFSVLEIARILGIPPHLLGDMEKSTSFGTGIETQLISLVRFTFMGWLNLIEQRATRQLLPGGWSHGSWFCEYDVEGVLRGDTAARTEWCRAAIQNGWMNRNEARGFDKLPPIEGLDRFLVPANLALVDDDGSGEVTAIAGSTNAPDPATSVPGDTTDPNHTPAGMNKAPAPEVKD